MGCGGEHCFLAASRSSAEGKDGEPRSQKLATLFAVRNDSPLREKGTEQARQFLKASVAVQIYADDDVRAPW